MPIIGDSELRVLMVVLMQTIGWQSSDGRKRREWVSHGWLMKNSGRSGQSVSDGLASLIERGIVEATDEQGKILRTKRERRAYKGKMYLGLAESLWNAIDRANPGLLTTQVSTLTSGLETLENIKSIKTYKEEYRNRALRPAVRMNGWVKASEVATTPSTQPGRPVPYETYSDPDYPQTESLHINGPHGRTYPEWEVP